MDQEDKSINHKKEWNDFIVHSGGSFLQSWQWGDLQEALGRKMRRIEADDLKALVIKHDLPFGKNYIYCPRGPVVKGTSFKLGTFLEKAKEIAKQEKSMFLKVEPAENGVLKGASFILSNKQIQPPQTIILDTVQSENEILGQMHQKTRYNIKLAQRKGVIIEEGDINNQETINVFLKLLKQTAERDKFFLHMEKYYRKMLEVLGEGKMIRLFLAKYKNQIIAANLVVFFNQTATYLHGASDYNFRQSMAPYLLQWRTILKAKELGLKNYDLYGINEKKWPGVTRFKRGFGGREVLYPGTFDLVYSHFWYSAYNIIRKMRKN